MVYVSHMPFIFGHMQKVQVLRNSLYKYFHHIVPTIYCILVEEMYFQIQIQFYLTTEGPLQLKGCSSVG